MNDLGLEEKDLKQLCVLHGGAVQASVQFVLLKNGKVASQLVGCEQLRITQEVDKTEKGGEK